MLSCAVNFLVCYTAVFSVVTQCSSPGALRDDTKNGCVADYQFPECMSFLAPSQTTLQANFKDDGFCGLIFAVCIYLRADRSFAVRGGG